MSRVMAGIAVFSAVLLPAGGPTAAAASVPPTPSPATVLTLGPFTVGMNQELQGSLCQSSNSCVPVAYVPFVSPEGVIALNNTLAGTSAGKIIVFAYSNGAEVAEQWLQQHASGPNAPSPTALSFVLIGNPTRASGGALAQSVGEVWPQSQYQVIDVARQYDGVADFPNNTTSPYYALAVANADAGFLTIHLDYNNVNINDPANAVWTVGNTTYVLVPTQTLPLLIPLQAIGFNVDALNAQLEPLVEQAYTRPVPFPTTPASPATSSPAQASALATSVVADPTVAPQRTTAPLSPPAAPLSSTTGAAPTVTGTKKNSIRPGSVAADTVTALLRTTKMIAPTAPKPGVENAIAAAPSTTAPATQILGSGNTMVTGKASGTRGIEPRIAPSPKAG